MHMDDDALDALLMKRRLTPARPGLAERIIATAQAKERSPSFTAWIADMLAEIALPRPAYALASVLAMGVIIGTILPDAGAAATDEEASLQLYLDEENSVL